MPKGKGSVARFPPIPRSPRPPVFPPDQRQRQLVHIVGTLERVTSRSMALAGPNLRTGFHASSVDLGQLQEVLERGLSRFDGEQLRERWDEIFTWIHRVLRAWTQRAKRLKIERREHGIRIEITTQDDLGYYDYAFDVFPRRK